MAVARRAGQAARRPRCSLNALRARDGGGVHARPGQDRRGAARPGRFLKMATTRVVMPQLGESVHEGTISKWLVKPGDKVVEFEPMLEVDTDKVNAEGPAPVSGVLREILAKEGETVQAGEEIEGQESRGGGGAGAPGTRSVHRRRRPRRTADARAPPHRREHDPGQADDPPRLADAGGRHVGRGGEPQREQGAVPEAGRLLAYLPALRDGGGGNRPARAPRGQLDLQ